MRTSVSNPVARAIDGATVSMLYSSSLHYIRISMLILYYLPLRIDVIIRSMLLFVEVVHKLTVSGDRKRKEKLKI